MNISIFYFLHSFANQALFLDQMIIFCAVYLPYVAVLIALIYFFSHYVGEFNFRVPFRLLKIKIKELFLVFFPAITGWLLADVLKNLYYYPRPFISLSDTVQPLFTHGAMDSFPSGHATFFAGLAISIFFVHKKVGKIYILIALIIGLARIMAGVHFPSDIIYGYIIGIIIAVIFHFVFRKWAK